LAEPSRSPNSPPSAADSLSGDDARAYLARAEQIIGRHRGYLTRLDAVLGDGDHGDNLAIGFRAVSEVVSGLPADASPGSVIRAAGHRLVAAVGGASGPLYGTAFIAAGHVAEDADVIDLETLASMLDAAASALARRGRCVIGDKTILDTLRPAAGAFAATQSSGSQLEECLAAAVTAARAGMLSTRPLIARRGLALRMGSRSAGHLDPGAVSCYLLVRAMLPVPQRAAAASDPRTFGALGVTA
jgi:phosphoenolpyruvate---glycerone phosphotransferase subunit DhaL